MDSPRVFRTIAAGFAIALALGMDTVVVWAGMVERLPPVAALGGHVAAVLVLVQAQKGLRLGDGTSQVMFCILVLFTGPVYALTWLAAVAVTVRVSGDISANEAERWPARLSGAKAVDVSSALYRNLVNDRAFKPEASSPRLLQLMQDGSRRERQAILGMIALNYHPTFMPVLQRGLVCPDSSIRVQAAAVFVKLRQSTKLRLKHCFDKAAAVTGDAEVAVASQIGLAREIESCTNNGVLDASDLRRALTRALELAEMANRRQPQSQTVALCCRLASRLNRRDKVVDYIATLPLPLSDEIANLRIESLMVAGRMREVAADLAARRLAAAGGAAAQRQDELVMTYATTSIGVSHAR